MVTDLLYVLENITPLNIKPPNTPSIFFNFEVQQLVVSSGYYEGRALITLVKLAQPKVDIKIVFFILVRIQYEGKRQVF